MEKYDALIIGGGVTGCAVARELSRYKLKIGLLEKNQDVCEGTSKANSAIIHAGFDAETGSVKARMNLRGNLLADELSGKLDYAFRRNGALVLCFNREDRPKLQALYERGVANGVEGLSILERDEILELEPGINPAVDSALYARTSGIVCPFEMTIAFAENAAENGVDFYLGREVKTIRREGKGYMVEACAVSLGGEKRAESFSAEVLINCAGVYADEMHNMVSSVRQHICPRRGQYYLLDKEAGSMVSRTVFQLPSAMGKGVLVTPTVHGNLLVGPTAENTEDKRNTATTAEDNALLLKTAALSVPGIDRRLIITSFTGLRAHEDGDDFILGEAEDAPGFFDCSGIESPGLTAAPAIAEYMAGLVRDKLKAVPREDFVEERKGVPHFASLSREEREELIRQDPSFGRIVCRCETVTEGEVLAAIHRPLGARTLDGVKRRTRAGMGRCQAGFCTPRTMELLSRELDIPLEKIVKKDPESRLILGENKDRLEYIPGEEGQP